jgi:hypothetical protein
MCGLSSSIATSKRSGLAAMGPIEFIFLAGTLGIGILAGGAFAVVGFAPADFRLARRLFWAAALLGVALVMLWGASTAASVWLRATISISLGGLSVFGLTEAIRWVSGREPAVPAVDQAQINGLRVTFDPNGPTEFYTDFTVSNAGGPTTVKGWKLTISQGTQVLLKDFEPRGTWPVRYNQATRTLDPPDDISKRPLQTGEEKDAHWTYPGFVER